MKLKQAVSFTWQHRPPITTLLACCLYDTGKHFFSQPKLQCLHALFCATLTSVLRVTALLVSVGCWSQMPGSAVCLDHLHCCDSCCHSRLLWSVCGMEACGEHLIAVFSGTLILKNLQFVPVPVCLCAKVICVSANSGSTDAVYALVTEKLRLK